MAQTGYTPIQLYRSSTAAAAPTAGNLADGELALNTADEKLYFKNASGVVKVLAAVTGASGTVSSVAASGGTTGLTFTGSPITTTGTLTLGGTLAIANGGTGATTAAAARTALGSTATGDALFTAASVAAARTTLTINNVDNTSDANKPVSTATQTALNLKANIASPSFTGSVIVNGSTASGQFNVRAASGVSAIVLDNPSGTETLSFTSRQVAGFATGYVANATFSIGTTTANTLQFVANNTIRYTISDAGIHQVNGAGNTGVFNIRATSGSAALVLDNSGTSERLHFTPRFSGGVSYINSQNSALIVGTADAYDFQFYTSGTYRGGISADGLTVLFTGVANSTTGSAANVYVDAATGRLYRSTSSERYKDVIGDYIPRASIDDIQPFFFKEKNNPNSPLFAGLSAEQMAALGFEEFVVRNANNEPEALHYPHITVLLVYEIQQLRKRVAALETLLSNPT